MSHVHQPHRIQHLQAPVKLRIPALHRLPDRLEHGAALASSIVLVCRPPGYARDLAYRLYATCDRMKWAKEALAYNSLIISWAEIARLMHAADRKRESQRFITGDEES